MGGCKGLAQRVQVQGLRGREVVGFFVEAFKKFVCLICDKRKRALVILPCAHFVLCGECYTEGEFVENKKQSSHLFETRNGVSSVQDVCAGLCRGGAGRHVAGDAALIQ